MAGGRFVCLPPTDPKGERHMTDSLRNEIEIKAAGHISKAGILITFDNRKVAEWKQALDAQGIKPERVTLQLPALRVYGIPCRLVCGEEEGE